MKWQGAPREKKYRPGTLEHCPMSTDGDHEWVKVTTPNRPEDKPLKTICVLCGLNQ